VELRRHSARLVQNMLRAHRSGSRGVGAIFFSARWRVALGPRDCASAKPEQNSHTSKHANARHSNHGCPSSRRNRAQVSSATLFCSSSCCSFRSYFCVQLTPHQSRARSNKSETLSWMLNLPTPFRRQAGRIPRRANSPPKTIPFGARQGIYAASLPTRCRNTRRFASLCCSAPKRQFHELRMDPVSSDTVADRERGDEVLDNAFR